MDTEARIVSTQEFALLFVLAVLATWRVSHLLAYEDGPADMIVRIRRPLGEGLVGSLMDCLNCLSLWVAAPAAFLLTRTPSVWVMSWLAISGGACMLQRLVEKPFADNTISRQIEGDDDVLR
jgi:hypothetical protein